MKISNVVGWIILLIIWSIISYLNIINDLILPSPLKTLNSFIEMIKEDHLIKNIFFSLKINFLGYLIAIGTALPFGFILGLFKTSNNLFSKPIDSLRFLPLTALSGLFIAISGLTIWTKVYFLAFGIWVYLVPVVVQRINEVSQVHLQMMKTLGANKLQTFKYVQWKYVISRLSDDIRILVGISWTYIIVAELKNVQGGLGSLIWLGEKQNNSGKVYAIIILIIIIGIIQDISFKILDKFLFKFKYK